MRILLGNQWEESHIHCNFRKILRLSISALGQAKQFIRSWPWIQASPKWILKVWRYTFQQQLNFTLVRAKSGLKREVRPISLSLPFYLPRTFRSEMIQVWHSLVVKCTIPGSRNQELWLPFKVYGFADCIQSSSNERKRDEVIYIVRNLNSIENKADEPPPTYTEPKNYDCR